MKSKKRRKSLRKIKAEDLYRIKLISNPSISPDGKHVVFCIRRPSRKRLKVFCNLWVVSTEKGKAFQFTSGDHIDFNPRWSPDGTKIAFISNRENEKQSQIFIIPFTGGEARKLTEMNGEFSSIEWSPDGKILIFGFRKKDTEQVEMEKDPDKKKRGIVVRHITRMFYKLDGRGYLPKDRWHIFTVNTNTGTVTQLTHGKVHDQWGAVWSPDGKKIVYLTNLSNDPDIEPDNIDICIMNINRKKRSVFKTPSGYKHSLSFSPNGKWIAYLAKQGKCNWWKNTRLWIIQSDGKKRPKNLTENHDFHISADTINDLGGSAGSSPPAWSKTGDRIFFQVSHHGNTVLKSITPFKYKPIIRTIINLDGVVGTYTFSEQGDKLVFFHANMKNPGQVFIRNMINGETRKLTTVNEKLLNSLNLGDCEEFWFTGPSGKKLQGWILKPPGFIRKKKYPSILEIHGGPRVQYGNFMMHEFYFLAAHGYVVFFCNPRGSQGYGESHSKAILNNWGTVDYQDLMAWTDFVERKSYLDKKRMGVTGGSYGGYMTNWIIGHTDRFKAAVTQRSVSNIISMYGSSDFNWTFQEEFGDRPPWAAFENYWRQSPMKYIGNAKTPTLVIHSEQDLRCAQEQGEQVFVALKKLGIDTELILFPDEPHGLSREGRTDRRIERLKYIQRWFDRYLKKR